MANTTGTGVLEQGHEAIARLLEENERTISWLARKLGMEQSHINRVVRGERRIMPDVAERMSLIFGVEASTFLPEAQRD
jgi:plasmid maintenance system antidote protein VapI